MPFSFLRLSSPTHLSRIFRQLEQDVETVINVLQPGPLGIVEHKYSATEVQAAKDTVHRAVETWRKNAALERSLQVHK
ncbi:Aldehyde dehydrogenase N-terminal protein [Dioscorea alata]|uniref:Aldehyde dehydrogenase N-terminal protein n=3 Tax=Dioscorea alata TaxID=55571 RepID=A0ACB7VQJ9_DIOAL|nr:Aldehyde dehydrogenase N-terminal protein [Dioscorea alata]KAH7676744.1 Aldehyde dehydrogenase N-terminal protein [Dioscorea alata]KAH7676746.1 Aldehyde dehydrogenase N-terminal protein [Dioscorea alata]